MTTPPSPAVRDAFGLDDDPVALPGGEGVTFRSGAVVLKRVHDAHEAEWTQSLLARLRPEGFRVPEPLPTGAGRWVHEGWTATRFIDGLRPAAPSWAVVADAGLRFGDAANAARGEGRDVLARRTHRWAVADRVAWGEARVDLDAEATDVHDQISVWAHEASREEHFVHGDLSGNVFLDPSGAPVILDVSPYLRPRRWAVAIVTADAVLWHGADVTLATEFASDATDRDLLARALIFRLVAEQLADHPRHGAQLGPYHRVVSALT